MKNAFLQGKLDAANPHVWFGEGGVASATPRRESLLDKFNRNIAKLGQGRNLAVLVILSLIASFAVADTITMEYAGSSSETAGPLCAAANSSGKYYWSDHLKPHDDADYSSAGKQFRTPISSDGTAWLFEGNSLDIKGYQCLVKTLLPSTLTFKNELRSSTYCTITHNSSLSSAADFTARLFAFDRVTFEPCPGVSYQGGFYLHGPFSSAIGTSANSAKYIQVNGKPGRPDTFADFDGDCSAWYGRVMVKDATITGASGFPNANYIELNSNSTIVVKNTGFSANCLRTTSATLPKAKVIFDSSTGSLGMLTLTGSTTFNATLTLTVTNMLALSAGGTFDLVKSDRAISSKVVLDPAVTNSFPSATCESVSEGGFYYIRLTVAAWPYVSLVQSANGFTASSTDIAAVTNGAAWSDGLAPSGGKNYYACSVKSGTTYVRTPYTTSITLENPVFPGASLVLGNNVWLAQCQRSFTVTNLVCMGGSTISFLLSEFNCTLSGGLDVRGTTSMIGWNNRTATIASEISGAGDLKLQILSPASTSSPWAYYSLTGLNTNFAGRLVVNYAGTNATYPNLDKCNTLYFTDKRNLGGPCVSFTYDALHIAHMSKLDPSVDGIVLDEPTRGIYIDGCGRFNVAADRALTIKQPITYNGTFRKEGAGHLAVGGRSRFTLADTDDGARPTADKNVFDVIAGSLQPLSTNAFDGVALTFSEGTSLLVDPTLEDADVLKYGLLCTSADGSLTLPAGGITVDVVGSSTNSLVLGATCGLVTVSTVNADAIRDLLTLAARRHGRIHMRVKERANDGEDTITFYLEFWRPGTTISFR